MTEVKEKEIRATPEAIAEQPMLTMRLGRTNFLIGLHFAESGSSHLLKQVGSAAKVFYEKDAVCLLHTHAGFINDELLHMSTLTVTRVREAHMLCDPYVKNWIIENNVELVGAENCFKEGKHFRFIETVQACPLLR